MARKSKNTDVVAASPLVATGVEKMIPSEIPNRLKSQFAAYMTFGYLNFS